MERIFHELSKLRDENQELKKLILSKDTSATSTDISGRDNSVLSASMREPSKSHSKKPSFRFKGVKPPKEITLKKSIRKADRTISKQETLNLTCI